MSFSYCEYPHSPWDHPYAAISLGYYVWTWFWVMQTHLNIILGKYVQSVFDIREKNIWKCKMKSNNAFMLALPDVISPSLESVMGFQWPLIVLQAPTAT